MPIWDINAFFCSGWLPLMPSLNVGQNLLETLQSLDGFGVQWHITELELLASQSKLLAVE